MQVLYKNIIADATITPSTEAVGYEASVSLKDTRLSRKWRTTAITSQSCVMYNATAPSATFCVVASHNLTSDAAVIVEGSDNGSSYTTIATVTPVRADGFITDENGGFLVDESGNLCETSEYPSPLVVLRDTRIISFARVGYPYYRVSISDPQNSAAYLEVGHIYIGEYVALPDMSPDMEIPTTSTADVSSSLSGQRYGDERVRLKTASVKAPAITNDQKIDIETWFDTVDLIDPFWLLVWESDLWAEMPIYCALTKDLKWKKDITGTGWTLDFEFLEVR